MFRTKTTKTMLGLAFMFACCPLALASPDENKTPDKGTNDTHKVVISKSLSASPKYPADFRLMWDEAGFVRKIEGFFASKTGAKLNAAQKKYIRTVMASEATEVAYAAYRAYGKDRNAMIRRLDKHVVQSIKRYADALLERAGAEQSEPQVNDAVEPAEDAEEDEVAAIPAA